MCISTTIKISSFLTNNYELRARFVPDVIIGFVVYATMLPCVVSQGDTHETAIKNICNAFQTILESYKKLNKEIPWQKEQKNNFKISGTFDLWLQVDLNT